MRVLSGPPPKISKPRATLCRPLPTPCRAGLFNKDTKIQEARVGIELFEELLQIVAQQKTVVSVLEKAANRKLAAARAARHQELKVSLMALKLREVPARWQSFLASVQVVGPVPFAQGKVVGHLMNGNLEHTESAFLEPLAWDARDGVKPVSYTHLTLPTICSV